MGSEAQFARTYLRRPLASFTLSIFQ
jgi:hypothetical protein